MFGAFAETWLEIYNNADAAVDLVADGMSLEVNGDTLSISDFIVLSSPSVGPGDYYVISLGSAFGSSDFADLARIDAAVHLSALPVLNSSGNQIALLDSDDQVIDEVDFYANTAANCFELQAAAVSGSGYSVMLRSTELHSPETNDRADQWEVAGDHNHYSVSGNHFGTPGTGESGAGWPAAACPLK